MSCDCLPANRLADIAYHIRYSLLYVNMKRAKKRTYNSADRKRRAEHTRERILDAARTLIARKGFAEATFESIAAQAGVAVPTVYAAFGSKSGIMQALISRATFSEGYEKLVR